MQIYQTWLWAGTLRWALQREDQACGLLVTCSNGWPRHRSRPVPVSSLLCHPVSLVWICVSRVDIICYVHSSIGDIWSKIAYAVLQVSFILDGPVCLLKKHSFIWSLLTRTQAVLYGTSKFFDIFSYDGIGGISRLLWYRLLLEDVWWVFGKTYYIPLSYLLTVGNIKLCSLSFAISVA